MFPETLTWDALRMNRELPRSLDNIIFLLRAIKVASEPAQRRFIRAFTDYVYGVIDEASDGTGGHIRGITDYFQLRRLTAGAYASLFSVELGLQIPDEVMEHSALQSLLCLTADSIVLTN